MKHEALVIGGSAGSFRVIIQMLEVLPVNISLPVFLCLHRLKQVRRGFEETLAKISQLPLSEPSDKENIRAGSLYLAPANYHMLIENKKMIALSIDDPVQYSRPSIDICFSTAAEVYKQGLVAILLSGANQDGTEGMAAVKRNGGYTMVQDPADCEIATMCESAINLTIPDQILTLKEIIEFVSLLGDENSRPP
jgi:two-component system chemotaxis response regulator CheB